MKKKNISKFKFQIKIPIFFKTRGSQKEGSAIREKFPNNPLIFSATLNNDLHSIEVPTIRTADLPHEENFPVCCKYQHYFFKSYALGCVQFSFKFACETITTHQTVEKSI